MIEYIKGKIENLNPASVTLETPSGVGYILSISLTTFSALENLESTKLLVHESIREDAYQLFGFASESERSIFRLLIAVSGIGSNTARTILSAIAPGELQQAIAANDVKRLKSVKGVGAKTAERLIIELRDKINVDDSTLLQHASAGAGETFDEALQALIVLGYARPQAQKALKKIFEAEPTTRVEVAIRKALAML